MNDDRTCAICESPFGYLDEPHTDPLTGLDVHSQCCEFCQFNNAQARPYKQIDIPEDNPDADGLFDVIIYDDGYKPASEFYWTDYGWATERIIYAWRVPLYKLIYGGQNE